MEWLLFILIFARGLSSVAGEKITLTEFSPRPLASAAALDLQKLKGHIVVMDFWASWCHSCREALPIYNQLFKKWPRSQVLLIGINEDDDAKAREKFLTQVPVHFPIYADTGQNLSRALQVDALPQLFIFDSQLQLVASLKGFHKENEKEIETKVNSLLKQMKNDKK